MFGREAEREGRAVAVVPAGVQEHAEEEQDQGEEPAPHLLHLQRPEAPREGRVWERGGMVGNMATNNKK